KAASNRSTEKDSSLGAPSAIIANLSFELMKRSKCIKPATSATGKKFFAAKVRISHENLMIKLQMIVF
ncbi:MAG TPA: hypothetical protein PKN21_07980, partial [Bacteroidales bacterium]|nr:hypothetical protein [Bacteroidales bacterium]